MSEATNKPTTNPAIAPITLKARTRSASHPFGLPASRSFFAIRSRVSSGVIRLAIRPARLTIGTTTRWAEALPRGSARGGRPAPRCCRRPAIRAAGPRVPSPTRAGRSRYPRGAPRRRHRQWRERARSQTSMFTIFLIQRIPTTSSVPAVAEHDQPELRRDEQHDVLGVHGEHVDRDHERQHREHPGGEASLRGEHVDLATHRRAFTERVRDVVQDLGEVAADLALDVHGEDRPRKSADCRPASRAPPARRPCARPSRISATTRWNSVAAGCVISRATVSSDCMKQCPARSELAMIVSTSGSCSRSFSARLLQRHPQGERRDRRRQRRRRAARAAGSAGAPRPSTAPTRAAATESDDELAGPDADARPPRAPRRAAR